MHFPRSAFLVDRSVLGDFLPLFVKGSPFLEGRSPHRDARKPIVGPMVACGRGRNGVMAMVADAVERGAKLAARARTKTGQPISPGIFDGR